MTLAPLKNGTQTEISERFGNQEKRWPQPPIVKEFLILRFCFRAQDRQATQVLES